MSRDALSKYAATESIAVDGRTLRRMLPQGYPFLMVDRVEAYEPHTRRITAVKFVAQNEPFLHGHFPGYPIFPGVLIIECLAQAAQLLMLLDGFYASGTPVSQLLEAGIARTPPRAILAESRVKHIAPVFPGDLIRLECGIALQSGDQYTFKTSALVSGREMTRGQLTLARTPLNPTADA